MSVSIAMIETLKADGDLERALRACARIPVDDLAAVCRVYVRGIEAALLVGLEREAEAREAFASILDDVPSWRPDSDGSTSDERRAFESARAGWVATNAGPLRVTPDEVSLLSAASDVVSSSQPLLIQAMQRGEISWRAVSEAPWIRLSRSHGTTAAGRDTLVVSARPTKDGDASGTRHGRLLFEAPPWPDVTVDVSWRVMGTLARGGDFKARRRPPRIAVLGFCALVTAGLVGVLVH